MENQDNFSHAACIFPVEDLQTSIDFYTQKLEFKLTFSWGVPTNYAVIKKGGVSIHLVKKSDDRTPSKKHCALYIFVYDIAKIYKRCVSEKVSIINTPETRDYNMKDFDIKDPDGYIITFGNGG